MTNEELVLQIQQGEDLYLQLWEQTERFIAMKAGDYFRGLEDGKRGLTVEDLIQAGFLALVDAVKTYSPERGALFLSYLPYHLHRHFVEAAGLRTDRSAADPINSKISLDRPVEDESADTLGDLQPDQRDALEEIEARIQTDQLRAALEKALAKLPERDAEALRLRYFKGMSLKAAAEAAGITQETLRGRTAHGLRELRRSSVRKDLEYFLELRTPYYRQTSFHTTQISPVESLVMLRERLRREYETKEKQRRETGGKIWRRHRRA